MNNESRLDQDPSREEEARFIKRLALAAVYEDDKKAIVELGRHGIKGEQEVLAKAREHEDFREEILLAKKYQRVSLDKTADPHDIMRVERELEDSGHKHGHEIFDLSRIIPTSFDDLAPFLSQKTLDFFKQVNQEKREGDAKVAKKLANL